MQEFEIDYELFQARLSSLIKSRNLSYKEFADEIGVTPPTISRYINGARKPELSPIIKIAAYCGVSIDWLLGITGERFDILPKDTQEIAFAYSVATPDDRKVVEVVLSKYTK